MRTLLVAALLALSLLALPTIAGARPDDPVGSQFIDFPEQVLDGIRRGPSLILADGKRKVAFERLLRLKRSFFPEMMRTADEPTFR